MQLQTAWHPLPKIVPICPAYLEGSAHALQGAMMVNLFEDGSLKRCVPLALCLSFFGFVAVAAHHHHHFWQRNPRHCRCHTRNHPSPQRAADHVDNRIEIRSGDLAYGLRAMTSIYWVTAHIVQHERPLSNQCRALHLESC